MGPSHGDAPLLVHRQLKEVQQQGFIPHLPQPQSSPKKLQRNSSASPHVPPPSPNRRVQSQQISAGIPKRPHGALRLPPRSPVKHGAAMPSFLGGASSLDDDATDVKRVLTKRDKGKGRAEDQDDEIVPRFRLEERAVARMPRMKPLVAVVASPTVTKSSSTTTRRRVRGQTTRAIVNAAVATPSTPAETAESLASVSSASVASVISASIASVTSAVAADISRSAASRIASRASILNSIAPSLLPSVQTQFSEASVIISSRRSAAAASASATSSGPTSLSQTSIDSSRPASSGQSSSSQPTATAAPGASNSNPNRIRDIVVPSVVVPVALALLALFLFFCQRRRHRAAKNRPAMAQHSNISNPILLGSNYGTGAGAGAGGGAAALMAQGGRRQGPNASAESFATTPSAIGVAFSEPRTKWGRRSLSDVVAAGAVGAGSAAAAGKGRGQVISASSSFGGGRQPSITNLSEVSGGSRPISPNAYRPGMPRPLMNPPGTQHYDPFSAPPSIVPVAARGSSTAWAAASSGSNSAYGSDDGRESLRGSGSDERQASTSHLPPAIAGPLPYSTDRPQHSRADTQTSGEDVFYTDQASSADDEELEEEELTAMQRPVDFGSSGSSGSEGVAGIGAGTPRPGRASASPSSTSTPSDRTGTPRLGAGHGSMGGVRKGDGSWW